MPRSSRSLFLIVSFALIILSSGALRSFAAISATADVSTPQTSAPFTYTVTVHNNGSTNIDTVWFAWTDVPADYDFLPTSPSNITAPTNWITPTFVTHGGFPGDGYGIEWYTLGSNPITPGSSSSAFIFTSNDTPTQLSGNAFFPGFKVTNTVVYDSLPGTGNKFSFVASVPEPASISLIALLAGAALRRRRSR